MNKLGVTGIAGVIVTLMVLMFTFGNFHTVTPGEVGIVVDQMGGDKGIKDAEIVSDGWTFTGPTEKMIKYFTRVEIKRYTADERDDSPMNQRFYFASSEGMKIGSDMTLRYRVDPTKVNLIYARYKKTVRDMAESDIWNTIGDLLVKHGSQMKIDEWIKGGKITMLTEVERELREAYRDYGIIIEKVAWFGEPELPNNVVAAINKRIQRENEVAEATANANKKIEIARGDAESAREAARGKADAIRSVAEAQAEANRKVSKSLTPELIEYAKTEKWNGKLPTFTGSGTPLISLGK